MWHRRASADTEVTRLPPGFAICHSGGYRWRHLDGIVGSNFHPVRFCHGALVTAETRHREIANGRFSNRLATSFTSSHFPMAKNREILLFHGFRNFGPIGRMKPNWKSEPNCIQRTRPLRSTCILNVRLRRVADDLRWACECPAPPTCERKTKPFN